MPSLDALLAQDRFIDVVMQLDEDEQLDPYRFVKPGSKPSRCCWTRFTSSLVTPTYSVPFLRLASM
jgi:hypothetical protein